MITAISKLTPWRISIIYAAFSMAWIWFSDAAILDRGLSSHALFLFGAWKGTLFVLTSTVLLFVLQRTMNRQVERLQSEHLSAIQENEEQLQLFVEHAPAALAMFDRDMRYLRVSARWLSNYGLKAESILGRSHYEVFPEIPDRWKQAHARGLAGEALFSAEDNFQRLDGSNQSLRWEIWPWKERTGAIGGIVIFVEDITEQLKLREEMKQLQAQFFQAQKMEAIGRLTGGIAHDFNNLLTVILAQSELLAAQSTDPAVNRGVSSIYDSTLRAAHLTRQLLAFSRKQVLQPTVQDLSAVLSSMHQLIDRLIGEDIRSTLTIGEGPLPVLVDRSQLEQVLMNLVVNARDSMPDGGSLFLEAQNEPLDDDLVTPAIVIPRGRYISITVRDTGCGIPAFLKQKIFEPFFTTKGPGKGTGLGLSTVFGIVKQSNGFILVDSEPGQGTSFKIYLPASDLPTASLHETTLHRDSMPTLHGTILVVDDQPAVGEMVAEILKSEGYRVQQADSAGAALAILAQHREQIALVITDLVLQDSNGLTLAEDIRRTGSNPKFIFMSGYSDEAIPYSTTLPPDLLFLQKPFGKNQLLRTIRSAI